MVSLNKNPSSEVQQQILHEKLKQIEDIEATDRGTTLHTKNTGKNALITVKETPRKDGNMNYIVDVIPSNENENIEIDFTYDHDMVFPD